MRPARDSIPTAGAAHHSARSFATCFESGERASLVLPHQPAVADNIGGQYGGKPALENVLDHSGSCPSEGVAKLYVQPLVKVHEQDFRQAVRGLHSGAGFGIAGDAAAGDTAGVIGRHFGSFEGHGVRGEGPIGVFGEGAPGVEGICTRSGGSSGEPAGELAGVRGNATGNGPGVFGAGRYGGQFKGTSAQLSLIPGMTPGKPTTDFHSKGEVYMDSAADLFVCVADGNPGTWRRIMTGAA